MLSTKGSEQNADFKSLYHHAPCGLITFDIDGRIIHCNQTLLEWLDIDEADLHALKFNDLLEKGGRLYYQLFVHPLLRMHKAVKEISFQIKTPVTEFSCLFSATVVAAPNTGENLIHAVIFKVVDRKKYEQELLSKKVKADKEKEQTTEALRMVAFAQSHLVRAPLANILGLVSIYENMNVSSEIKEINEMLKNSALQLDTEIRKIVSQTDSGNHNLGISKNTSSINN